MRTKGGLFVIRKVHLKILFYGKPLVTGSELKGTDVTLAGTRMVKEINPGTANGATGQALAVCNAPIVAKSPKSNTTALSAPKEGKSQ